MARFFIDRPIFAWVIAIVIMLAGGFSINRMSLEQYPDIAPVRISVNASYTGANAQTIEDSVTQVIEQQMKGLDGLQNMAASSSAGSSTVVLNFVAGTDADVAQMQVQNKVQQALSRLPQAVQSMGVTVTKSGTDFLMVITLVSEDVSVTSADIADYVSSTLSDQFARIDGVGDVTGMGSSYAMRIWLDPNKLAQYALMPSDVSGAIESQNTQVAVGQLGALPAVADQALNATITARSKLRTVEQFQEIILKYDAKGAVVKLSDVARVELGSQSYTVNTTFNGKPSAGMGIKLATGANALGVAEAVKTKLAQLEPGFPMRLKAVVAYDTTPFVRISIKEVLITLAEAMVLVVLVMGLFMQSLRATFIPAIAVPVVLLGTVGVLAAAGYSINTLTMFGLVLAIGLLVDDAIVVVENVERLMREEGLSPREATRKSMGEITGALVGISLVLSAVFIPMAFFSGSTGVIYRQFSITIVSAMALSVLVALTLTPALCATLLRPHGAIDLAGGRFGFMRRFFGAFNRQFERRTTQYQGWVQYLLSRGLRVMIVYGVLAVALVIGFLRLPTSFLPDEDQGVLMAMVQLPSGATDARTVAVLKDVQDYLRQQPEVKSYLSIRGLNGDQASANFFLMLKDWSEREKPGQSAAELAARYTRELATVRDARVFVMLPPAIRGLGSNAGFTLELKDAAGLGHDQLVAARDQFLQLARKDVRLMGLRASGLDDAAEISVSIDDRKANALGVSTADVNATLSAALGGSYVNDFIHQSRVKRVYLQGDAPFRMQPQDIGRWQVRGGNGDMVPLSAFTSITWTSGPQKLERYNGFSAMEIVGSPAPGVSSGAAMVAVEDIVAKLPQGITYEWAGQSYQERLSGSQAPALYAVSILFVFLCLAALYESWSVPFSVMLVVPLGLIGAVGATWLAGLNNDVYFQIGLLTTVGLSAKNAILIVEFAQQLVDQGQGVMRAVLQAVKLRLRPILMTSLAFIFGVLPLALASGAGAGSRQAIGTGVVGGMLSATVLGVFFIPVFYVVVRRIFSRSQATQEVL
ncbi:efflux RND transporter permease subunit [Hylemonella gracilis]|uniref:Efflux pump membrane transporter n=1 Tax=Hylemonella gracilis ATCC 19624 TaxID=887062 RepID=F3KV58_9BURK|nr:efflux RND transporter permease subunit [Hylemonella gracilis]EGI76333.1 cation/multidrug efflux pump protein [Hylemonella gracilis ATCC 19624]